MFSPGRVWYDGWFAVPTRFTAARNAVSPVMTENRLMFNFISIFHTVAGSLDFLTLLGLAGVQRRCWKLTIVAFWATACLLCAVCFNPYRHGIFTLVALTLWIHLPVLLLGTAVIRFMRQRCSRDSGSTNTRGSVEKPLRRALTVAMVVVAIGILGVGFYANRMEPYRLETTEKNFRSAKIRERRRIVVVSDLHIAHVGDYERTVFQRIAELEPDIVVLDGDIFQPMLDDVFVNHGFRVRQDFRRTLLWRQTVAEEFRSAWTEAKISPELGTWVVQGNHDQIWGVTPSIPGVVWLQRTLTIPLGSDLLMTFLSANDSRDADLNTNYADIAGTHPTSRFRLMVGHHPDPAENRTLTGEIADLFIAGHTHGGQLQIPGLWPLIRRVFNSPTFWMAGEMKSVGGVPTYVTCGTGLAGLDSPRFRLNCRPEILLLTLEPENAVTTDGDFVSHAREDGK